jgi:hypothetical protein
VGAGGAAVRVLPGHGVGTRTEALRFGDVVYVENFAVSDLAARLDEALHERARLSQRWADVESLGHLPSLTWPG